MMYKYELLPDVDLNGNPTVSLLGNRNDGVKVAGYDSLPKEMQSYISDLEPKEGYAYLLVSALGDQNWGSNKNADYWPTEGLKNDTDEFGYKTFEKFGCWFHQHRNNSVDKAYGKVIKSVWNDMMGRVELIVEVDLSKDDEVVRALANDEIIKTSMGAKVPYDICKICHPNWKEFYKIPEDKMKIISTSKSLQEIHSIGKEYGVDLSYIKKINPRKVSSRVDVENASSSSKVYDGGAYGISVSPEVYCHHMKNHKNEILPDGQLVCVVNLRPVFFDISKVRVNADKSSFVLAKVASESVDSETIDSDEAFARVFIKASEDKKADIEKVVDGDILTDDFEKIKNYYAELIEPELSSKEKSFPDKFIDELARSHSPEDICASMSALGMFPQPREFQRIVLINGGASSILPEIDRSGCFMDRSDIMKVIPDVLREFSGNSNIGGNNVKITIIKKVASAVEERSGYPHYVVKRIANIDNAPTNKYAYRSVDMSKVASEYDFEKINHACASVYVKTAMECMCASDELVEKVAKSAFGLLASAAIPAAVSYFVAGRNEVKRRKGEKPGVVSNFIGNHPVLTGVIGASTYTGALPFAGKMIDKGMDAIKNPSAIFDKIKKIGSVNSNLDSKISFYRELSKGMNEKSVENFIQKNANSVEDIAILGLCLYLNNSCVDTGEA